MLWHVAKYHNHIRPMICRWKYHIPFLIDKSVFNWPTPLNRNAHRLHRGVGWRWSRLLVRTDVTDVIVSSMTIQIKFLTLHRTQQVDHSDVATLRTTLRWDSMWSHEKFCNQL